MGKLLLPRAAPEAAAAFDRGCGREAVPIWFYGVTMTPRLTARPELDSAVTDLVAHAEEWAHVPIPSRMAMLMKVRDRTAAAAERWANAAASAKGLDPASPMASEEWLSGPYALLMAVEAFHETLDRLWRGKPTYKPRSISERADGAAVARILPVAWHDRLLLSGYRAEVWMQPGVTPDNLAEHTASAYRQPPERGEVCLVLGAGNIASIPPLDLLHKLYNEHSVVAMKMSPVNEYLGPIFEEIFAEFVDRGFVRFVFGGAGEGRYLIDHPGVDSIHITGSQRTHDAIVFGTGDEGEARRARREPLLDKPISSELGGVSPVIVVPGPWTEEDLQFHAEHFVTQKLNNGGFNCIAAQVLVVPEGWEHTDRFLELVEQEVAAAPRRPPYYPGARDRQQRAADGHDNSVHLGADAHCAHLRDVAWDDEHRAFTEEFFSSVFATTRLPYDDVSAYVDAAVRFANERLHGTLGASIFIHPKTIAQLGDRFDAALADLEYGTIAVNAWSAMGFLLPRAPWGAYPGAPLHDAGSGRGVVHNALMFDRPEKTVVTGPFRPFTRAWRGGEFHMAPKPPWFVTHRTAVETARGLTAFAADGSLRHLPSIFRAGLSG